MGSKEFQLLMLFWQLGLVDTFSFIKLCVNGGAQYTSIALASAAGNTTQLGIKTALAPILGIGTSYQFVMAAVTAVERRKRIATLAAFLSASAGALTTDPATNGAIGGAIASKIGYMKHILAMRGGSLQFTEYVLIPSLKNYLMKNSSLTVKPLLTPAQIQLQRTHQLIYQNICAEHTQRRVIQGLAQKRANQALTKKVLGSISSERAIRFLPEISVFGLLGYYYLGIALVGGGIYCGLTLLGEAKTKHAQMMLESKSSDTIIDVKSIDV